jgi:hypothetical protein
MTQFRKKTGSALDATNVSGNTQCMKVMPQINWRISIIVDLQHGLMTIQYPVNYSWSQPVLYHVILSSVSLNSVGGETLG